MFERIVVIGSAILLAALVLVLTLLSEPSTPKFAKQSIDEPLNLDMIPEFDPNRGSGRFDSRGQAKKYRISSVNSRGQLIELYGDTVTPLPDGVTRVTTPGARIHLAPSRVLSIRAEKGTVLAPDNQIRSGHFFGDVLLTLFDAGNRRVDLSPSSHDKKLHVYLRDAQFDVELGHIESDHHVHMIGPRMDFRGTGLNLTYNEKRRRIDRLEIARGQSFRFIPQHEMDTKSVPAVSNSESSQNGNTVKTDAPTDQNQASDQQPTNDLAVTANTTTNETEPIQYYRARFEDRVRIQGPHAVIEVDRFDIVFSLNANTDQNELFNTLSMKPASPIANRFSRTRGRLNQTHISLASPLTNPISSLTQHTMIPKNILSALIPVVLAQTVSLDNPTMNPLDTNKPHHDVLIDAQVQKPNDPLANDDEITITWSGRLLIQPEDSPPIDMVGPDDLLVEMVGTPVRITTKRSEIMTAASVDYLASTGRVRMIGSQTHPTTIRSPHMGLLQAQRLVLHQDQGTGEIIGAGILHAQQTNAMLHNSTNPGEHSPRNSFTHHKSKPSDFNLIDTSDSSDGLTISWQNRVDLNFYNPNTPVKTQSNPYQMNVLRKAIFQGQIRVTHPQLKLECDQLAADFTSPIHTKQTLQAINATTNIHATVRGSNDQPLFNIHSDELTIAFQQEKNSTTSRPTQLVATGHVTANQSDRFLKADELKVDLEVLSIQEPFAAITNASLPPWLIKNKPWHYEKSLSFAEERQLLQNPSRPDLHVNDLFETEIMNVKIFQSSQESWSLMNETNLIQQEPGTPTHTNEDRNSRYGVRTVTARNNVHVKIDDPIVEFFADRLEADTQTDQIELFGLEDQPVHIDRYDGSLTGDHIILNHSGQSVHVVGPGKATFLSSASKPNDPTAIDADEADLLLNDNSYTMAVVEPPNEPTGTHTEQTLSSTNDGTHVVVIWTQAMHFDNRFGLAQFIGDVVSSAESAQESTQLSAQDLRIEFTDLTTNDSAVPLTTKTNTHSVDHHPTPLTRRMVRQVTARENVIFSLSRRSNKDDNQIDTRVRITGPIISFDNVVEQIQVIGPGRLFIEDYRIRNTETNSLFAADPTGQPRFTGRGATLMRWTAQLTLDAFHNDMQVDHDVQMIHRSLDSQQSVQLDCQRLLADLEATGGLSVWLAGRAAQPNIKAIYADDHVRVLSDQRTIITDHLEYTGFDQTVLLRSNPGRLSEIQEDTHPSPLSAERFRWDLATNRIEIIKPGPSHIPLK